MKFEHILGVVVAIVVSSTHASDITLLPRSFSLHGSDSRQQLSVVVSDGDTLGRQLAFSEVKLTSDDPEIVKIVGNVAIPTGNGETTLTAVFGNKSVTARATVKSYDRLHQWSFRNDVQSILSKLGCNMGACHGALAGKGGFRLSLRGYDSDTDCSTITRQARGRRVELADPGRSLLLAKPTGALPHKGGLRLETDSRNYRILADWIASGANPPQDDDPRLQKITVTPQNSMLGLNDQTQILVSGHYDDGRVIDVTQWAMFTATNEAVASVDDEGIVTVRGSGEGAVLVWFGSQVQLARMTVPFKNEVNDADFVSAPRQNFIDDINLEQLRTLRLEPAKRCDDETFLRRATIDTIGRLPTIDERTVFLNDTPPQRRERLIERLLASEDYVDYWTYKWSDMLLVNGNKLRPLAVKSYHDWIRQNVRENTPWDMMVSEILTATGKSEVNGATNFYALHQSPEEMTENACQAFLGLSIGCAKCHNHPLEKWTNDQYYGMANLFARVRAKGWGGDSRNGDGIRTLYVTTSGDLIQPSRGKPQPPAPLDEPAIPFDDPSDRREVLADWLTNPSNPYFSRAITNRIWKNFFSRGLVEQVDDLRLSNPASNEKLLDAAAEHLAKADFDLKLLMRAILRSETYQRSSEATPNNQDDTIYLSRYYPRRLMAEVLLDSVDQVLQTQTPFKFIAFAGADRKPTDFYVDGTKAIELYDSAVDSYFLKIFGRNPREITCECERSDEPSMVQVLHLSNGETLNPKLMDTQNRINRMLESGVSNNTIVKQIFMAALSREPTTKELDVLLSVIAEYGDDVSTAIQDATWSLLTSTEFMFNH